MAARKATDDEIKAALTGRTVAEAAQILGLHERNVYTHKARLARQGWSPEHGLNTEYPDGFKMGKVTIQRNADGEIVNTWERMDSLETVFIAKFREVFGRTKHSYAHTGHLHHNVLRETNTMQIEQHRTLAAPDTVTGTHSHNRGIRYGRPRTVGAGDGLFLCYNGDVADPDMQHRINPQ